MRPVRQNVQVEIASERPHSKRTLETYLNVHFCDSSFAKKCGLKRHLITHTGKKPYKCTECEKSYGYSFVLRDHVLRVHGGLKSGAHNGPNSSLEVFKCDQCNKQFSVKQALTKHLRTHTAKKIFQCSECNECFAFKEYLTRHKWKHTDRFKCEECGKTFIGNSHLKNHFKIHEKQRKKKVQALRK